MGAPESQRRCVRRVRVLADPECGFSPTHADAGPAEDDDTRREEGGKHMELTSRETWTLIHGLILGSLFLLAFAGGLAGLYSFRADLVTPEGIRERLFRLRVGVIGMEWKEHIAWIAPMLATAAAFLVLYYGRDLVADKRLRMIVLVLFVGAFATAAIAGLFGALITKAAPVR